MDEIHDTIADDIADKLLSKDVTKERITKEDAAAVRARLTPTTQMQDLSQVDFVIEAVPVGSKVFEIKLSGSNDASRKFWTSKRAFLQSLPKSVPLMPFLQQIPRQSQSQR